MTNKLDELFPDKQLREEAQQEEKARENLEEVAQKPALRKPIPPKKKVAQKPVGSKEEIELQRALSSIEEKLSKLE